MQPHIQTTHVKLFCADALDVLRSLEANSVDLIATDPPYFKVKDEDWDHQWSTATDFLAWLDDVLTECKRVLNNHLGQTQWQQPSPEHYARLQALFARKASTQKQTNHCSRNSMPRCHNITPN